MCIFASVKQKYTLMIDFANSGMTRPMGVYGAIKDLDLHQSLAISADVCKRNSLQQYCWRFKQVFGVEYKVHFEKDNNRFIVTRTA